MNTLNNENGNSKMPEAPAELVIEDEDTVDTIREKTETHNEAVRKYKEDMNGYNSQLYARTKKAEGFEFKDGKWVKPDAISKGEDDPASQNANRTLSDEDLVFVTQANMHKDDLKEVTAYAKNNKVTVEEAYNYLKPIIDVRVEQRKTADTTNTNGSPRGNAKVSDESLLANASKGKLPESEEDLRRLAKLQIEKNRQ